ncbi:MAG: hypothetical protein BMS9Abin05_2680 [Rhodothermia bacterium]|nr:MAG: hypothetical protein BMS9Abin05_2680 [Rhodothermia bacterium]
MNAEARGGPISQRGGGEVDYDEPPKPELA